MNNNNSIVSRNHSPIINNILPYIPYVSLLSLPFFFPNSFKINNIMQSCSIHTRMIYTQLSNTSLFSLVKRLFIKNIPQQTPTEKYLEKYTDKLKRIEDTKITAVTEHSNRIVIENTPLGTVAMLYDYERSAFVYYTNTTMPNNILNVVARKYATQFYTPQLLDRHNSEKDNDTDNDEKKKDKKNTGGIHSKKSKVRFAKLKSAAMKIEGDTVNTNTQKNTENNDPRFICIGRIMDMMILRKPPKEKVSHNKYMNMTFADFKNMKI